MRPLPQPLWGVHSQHKHHIGPQKQMRQYSSKHNNIIECSCMFGPPLAWPKTVVEAECEMKNRKSGASLYVGKFISSYCGSESSTVDKCRGLGGAAVVPTFESYMRCLRGRELGTLLVASGFFHQTFLRVPKSAWVPCTPRERDNTPLHFKEMNQTSHAH